MGNIGIERCNCTYELEDWKNVEYSQLLVKKTKKNAAKLQKSALFRERHVT